MTLVNANLSDFIDYISLDVDTSLEVKDKLQISKVYQNSKAIISGFLIETRQNPPQIIRKTWSSDHKH